MLRKVEKREFLKIVSSNKVNGKIAKCCIIGHFLPLKRATETY